MLDNLKKERRRGGGSQSRLRAYMAGLVVLGGVVLVIAQWGGEKGPEKLPTAVEDPAEAPPPPAPIDLSRLPEGDDSAVHAALDADALSYLLTIVDRSWIDRSQRVAASELAAMPFAEARGGVFEIEGRVEELTREEFRTETQRLWSLVLAGPEGHQFVVLKHGFGSDVFEGQPEEAFAPTTEYIQVGDRILVRGIYLQRRTGTIGQSILRDPVPVLVATPPVAAFRKLPDRADPIADPAKAHWDLVEDRFLSESRIWDEDALFQVLQWARSRGHESIRAEIESGTLASDVWDQDTFSLWSPEVKGEDATADRPTTTGARGRLFRTRGLLEAFVREGWHSLPRKASRWDVDTLYVLDLASDHYGNKGIRAFCPFPVETFEGITGDRHQHVTLYGYFMKNYTYETKYPSEEGGAALLTMPMFIVVHIAPVQYAVTPYKTLMWVIAGIISILVIAFVFLIRGEGRESQRMQDYRVRLRKRTQDGGGAPQGSTEGEGDGAP